VTLDGHPRWLLGGEGALTQDGQIAIAFGWERPAAPAGAPTVVLVSGADRTVVVRGPSGEKSFPLADGLAIANGAVRLGAFMESATRNVEYATASPEWRNPAVFIAVTHDGGTKEQLLLTSRPRPILLDENRAILFERREQEAKAYLSHVTAKRDSDKIAATVAVNDPFKFAGWTLYQANYNPQDPEYSGLDAVYDPGVGWVFLGFGLISLGVFMMFYVDPRFRAQKQAAPAA
jgi:hypothetical protein